ncbi:MAG: haloacid dehalogenase-like hydrolase [Selenomonadaceae bacterium]|nr:haloacid dehalogenase-like hydrolase [Selenomonadaceae bacterium]
MRKKILAAVTAGLIAFGTFNAVDAMPREQIAKIQVKKASDFKFWTKDAVAKQKLVEFVTDVTNKKSKNFIPVEDRLAVFDMDGTFIGESMPCYFEWMLYLERALHDPNYTPTLEDKAYAEMVNAEIYAGHFMTGKFPKGIDLGEAKSQQSVFAGMTPADYEKYVKKFMEKPVEGLTNLKWGEAFYLPMVEVIKYLQANNFTVYVVTGSDRPAMRVMASELLKIPYNQVIGTNPEIKAANQGEISADDYTYRHDDYLIRGQLTQKNLKMNKVVVIEHEIGKQPVLAFGNSGGDTSMLNYAITGNKYKSLAFFVICDDTERELGNIDKANKCVKLADSNGWIKISMKNDFKTIYGDEVKRDI